MTTSETWEEARQARNTHFHLQRVADAVRHLNDWPCITTISNMRLTLDDFERDIKRGDCRIGRGQDR